MQNFEAALAQLEKSKDNSGLPNWEALSQLQNSKDNQKSLSGILPNFDLLMQQQLSQNSKESGGKSGLLNWEALAQLHAQSQNSKDSLKNLASGMPNLDLLLQLQLSKDSSSSKNFPGWDALSLAQMQLAQGQLGKDNQSKHQGNIPNFDMLAQLQSFKDNKMKGPHGMPNFEALALAQLQLAQGIKDSQNKPLSNIPNFEAQMGQNLKETYSKNLALSGIPNFEALVQMQMGKNSKDGLSKNYEGMPQMQGSKESKSSVPNFEGMSKENSGKGGMPMFQAFSQLNQGLKDVKNLIPNFNFEGLNQFQMPSNSKDINASAIPPFPNYEALALAQMQLSQGSKDKNVFGGVSNLEAMAKFQMGQNTKDVLKSLGALPGYEDLQSKGNDWENSDGGSKDKK